MHNQSYLSAALRAAFLAGGLAAIPSVAVAQPAISVRVTPAPNASGWNNSEVTVTFVCLRASFCPEAVLLKDEGAGWRVTRSAIDESRREASVTAVVNIDRTPPSVTITSPGKDASLDAQTVTVWASVQEFGSGIRNATCNGRPATARDAVLTCPVTLQEGINDVIVQAMDMAGNSGSSGVHVSRPGSPSSPTVVPGMATMHQGERRSMQLVDALGQPLTRAAWLVSNPFIATIEQVDDEIAVHALGPGQVTVTASWGQLTAEAQITVVRGETLPAGTTRWKVAPRAGFTTVDIVYTHPTPDGPDMFAIERETGGRRVSLKAVNDTPNIMWVESPAFREDEEIVNFMGESFGGVLFRVDGANGRSSAIVRAGRPSHGPLWRYESTGTLAHDFAQGWDGTVYVVETTVDGFPHFLGFDGATGMVKFRWPIPTSARKQMGQGCPGDVMRDGLPAVTGSPTVPDGEVSAFSFVTLDEIVDDSACTQRTSRVARTLHLVRATSLGETQVRALKTLFGSTEASTPVITALQVVPNYFDAVLVPWIVTWADGRVENHVTRVKGDEIAEYTLPFMGEVGIGDDTAYTVTADGRTLVVFDPVSGRVKYVKHASVGKITVVAVTASGGLVTYTTGPLLDENFKPEALPQKK